MMEGGDENREEGRGRGRHYRREKARAEKHSKCETETSPCVCAIFQTAAQREWEDRASTPPLNWTHSLNISVMSSLPYAAVCSRAILFLCSGRATPQLWQVGWPEGRKDWLGCFKVTLGCCLFVFLWADKWHNVALRRNTWSNEEICDKKQQNIWGKKWCD